MALGRIEIIYSGEIPVSKSLLILVTFLILLRLILRPKSTTVPIKSRHVFISGGSSGIGLSLAKLSATTFSASKVSILARSRPKLDEAVTQIRSSSFSANVGAYSADVRDYDAVKKAVEESGDDVDVLICNHGIFVPRELEKQDLEEIRFTMDVNVMGTFNLIKAALPGMKRRVKDSGLPGCIAIMSSQGGQVGVYGYTAYSASKFALRGLAEALQHEVINDNIRVTLIFPPDTETPGFELEQKMRPEVTKLIAGSSGAMKADDVAKIALDGIKSGKFTVPCNFEGTMLSIATAGLSPQSSFLSALVEVLGAGFMRFLGLFFQWNWFNTIKKYYAKEKRN